MQLQIAAKSSVLCCHLHGEYKRVECTDSAFCQIIFVFIFSTTRTISRMFILACRTSVSLFAEAGDAITDVGNTSACITVVFARSLESTESKRQVDSIC